MVLVATRGSHRQYNRRHMDDEHGGGALLEMLHADLRFVTELLKHGSYKEEVGRSLYAAAGELARLAGWAAFDSDHHAAAQQRVSRAFNALRASLPRSIDQLVRCSSP